jgi:fructokinase
MQPEIVALGETLVDFIPEAEPGTGHYVARPGGAPANVAVGLARLGRRAAFVGRVGIDSLGTLLVASMDAFGVDTAWIQRDKRRPTTVAVVMPPTDSLVRFLIYGSGTAASALAADEVPLDAIRSARFLHVGTLSMVDPTARRATRLAVETALDAAVPVSLDVNLRASAWPSREAMRRATLEMLERASIVKATPEELAEVGRSADQLTRTGTRILLVTDGERGASVHTSAGTIHLPAPAVPVVDPTGAGDAFMAAFLDGLLTHAGETVPDAGCWLSDPPPDVLGSVLGRAIRAGAFAVGRVGAMESLPTRQDLDTAPSA